MKDAAGTITILELFCFDAPSSVRTMRHLIEMEKTVTIVLYRSQKQMAIVQFVTEKFITMQAPLVSSFGVHSKI